MSREKVDDESTADVKHEMFASIVGSFSSVEWQSSPFCLLPPEVRETIYILVIGECVVDVHRKDGPCTERTLLSWCCHCYGLLQRVNDLTAGSRSVISLHGTIADSLRGE
jgi:hypothetical protein